MKINDEKNVEIARIQELMNSSIRESVTINLTNKLISQVSKKDELWSEKIKIIGYLTSIHLKNDCVAIDKLKTLLIKFPQLELFTVNKKNILTPLP